MQLNRRLFLPTGLLIAKNAFAMNNPYGLETNNPKYDLLFSGANELMELWPNGVPGGKGGNPEIIFEDRGHLNSAVRGISHPLMQVYRPKEPNGTSLLIIPGGGYRHLAIGPGLPNWFSAHGVTCFNLLYRLPEDGWAQGSNAPLQDALRALRMIRSNCDRFGIDRNSIGVFGSSAGGHVAGQLITRFDDKQLTEKDELRDISARPDFACLNYPVITMIGKYVHEGSRKRLLGSNPSKELMEAFSIEKHARKDTPATFISHAIDDQSVPIENSIMMMKALQVCNVPTELHLFEQGGHGFNLATQVPGNTNKWPLLFLDWINSQIKRRV
jgi:acetyl esterase/lipase